MILAITALSVARASGNHAEFTGPTKAPKKTWDECGQCWEKHLSQCQVCGVGRFQRFRKDKFWLCTSCPNICYPCRKECPKCPGVPSQSHSQPVGQFYQLV